MDDRGEGRGPVRPRRSVDLGHEHLLREARPEDAAVHRTIMDHLARQHGSPPVGPAMLPSAQKRMPAARPMCTYESSHVSELPRSVNAT